MAAFSRLSTNQFSVHQLRWPGREPFSTLRKIVWRRTQTGILLTTHCATKMGNAKMCQRSWNIIIINPPKRWPGEQVSVEWLMTSASHYYHHQHYAVFVCVFGDDSRITHSFVCGSVWHTHASWQRNNKSYARSVEERPFAAHIHPFENGQKTNGGNGVR